MNRTVILAAGCGRRLGATGADVPKCLLEVGGRTILERAIAVLAAENISEVVVATGHRADDVAAAAERFAAARGLGTRVVHNPRYAETNNLYSLWTCAAALGGEGFVKIDGDLLFAPEILARLLQGGSGSRICVDTRASLTAESMKARLQGNRVADLAKSLPEKGAGESIGLELLTAETASRLFDLVGTLTEEERDGFYYEDAYARLITQGENFEAVDVAGLAWLEVDTLEELEEAQARFGALPPGS